MTQKVKYNVGDQIGVFKYIKDLPKIGNQRILLLKCPIGHEISIERFSAINGTKCRECRSKRVGNPVNNWTILRKVEQQYVCKGGQKINLYEVQCVCGFKSIKSLANIKSAGCKNCTRGRGAANWTEIEGKRFHNFLVIGPSKYPVHRKSKYRCLCDCGIEFSSNRRDILAGDVFSCGCYRKRNELQSIINRAYLQHKQDAKSRNYLSEITIEQYADILKNPCIYCGGMYIRTNSSTGAKLPLNSLDRKDNEPFYRLKNVQPVCLKCQRAKMDMTDREFRDHIETILMHGLKTNKERFL